MKTKSLRILVAAVLSLTLVLTTGVTTTFAASDASAPKIEDVDYDTKGEVDVDFYGTVKYKNVKVMVTDAAGTTTKARIKDKDKDELDFVVKNVKGNSNYKFTISGIKKTGAKSFTSVSGTFETPAKGEILIDEIEYDPSDKELNIEFTNTVSWKKPTAKITDGSGKAYTTKIIDRDSDEIELRIQGLKGGTTYTYTITGIKSKAGGGYTTITGTFSTPATDKVKVKDIDYDVEDRELSFDFASDVRWKSTKVTITDSQGKSYTAKITDRSKDDLEVRVKLKEGKKYNYTISGIKAKDAASYTTISGTFRAIDD